jgi:hypothetical protein
MLYYLQTITSLSVHKLFLSTTVIISFVICITGAAYVSAQSTVKFDNHGTVQTTTLPNKYFFSRATYESATLDTLTGAGTLVVSREDEKRGTIVTKYILVPKTIYLRRYGGVTTLSEFRVGDELSLTTLRNPDGSLTVLTLTDNNLWFLDTVIQSGEIMSVDSQTKTLTVIDNTTEATINVTYSNDTDIQKPASTPGTEADLVVGKSIKVRGVVRQTGGITAVEQSYVIWILPEHGE